MYYPILIAMAGLVPAAFLVLRLRGAQTRRLALEKAAFAERLPRPPGEHLRHQISELEICYAKTLESLLLPCLVVTSIAMIASIGVTETHSVATHRGIGALAFVVAGFTCYRRGPRLVRLLKDLENYRLHFDCERRVGNLLTALEHDGYSVFHDLKIATADGTEFNIDHVVLGPAGTFAIGTRNRRKSPHNLGRFEITPRGNYLEFSDGYCGHDDIDGIRECAWAFEGWLSHHIQNPGPVHPVLTYPGWCVNRGDVFSDIPVLNPKQIRDHVLSLDRACVFKALDPARIAALRNLLNTATSD